MQKNRELVLVCIVLVLILLIGGGRTGNFSHSLGRQDGANEADKPADMKQSTKFYLECINGCTSKLNKKWDDCGLNYRVETNVNANRNCVIRANYNFVNCINFCSTAYISYETGENNLDLLILE